MAIFAGRPEDSGYVLRNGRYVWDGKTKRPSPKARGSAFVDDDYIRRQKERNRKRKKAQEREDRRRRRRERERERIDTDKAPTHKPGPAPVVASNLAPRHRPQAPTPYTPEEISQNPFLKEQQTRLRQMREWERQNRFGREQRIGRSWDWRQGVMDRAAEDFRRKDSWALEGWLRDRDQIQSRWDAGLRQTLGRWDRAFARDEAALKGLRDQYGALAEEVTRAPSSVEQQARQNYDRQLAQTAMLAAAQGRGVSGGDQALRDQAANASARIMGQTAAARSDEYLQRLGMRGQLLGQQGDLVGRLSGLALNDANLRNQLYGRDFEIGGKLAQGTEHAFGQSAGRSWNMARGYSQDMMNAFNTMEGWRDKGLTDQLNVEKWGLGSNLAAAQYGLQSWIANQNARQAYDKMMMGQDLSFAQLNALNQYRTGALGLSRDQMLLGIGYKYDHLNTGNQAMNWQLGLKEGQLALNQQIQDYNEMFNDRAWQDKIAQREAAERSAFWNNVLGMGAGIAGGIGGFFLGGPAGAAAGYGIGSGLGGGLVGGGTGGGMGNLFNLSPSGADMPGFGSADMKSFNDALGMSKLYPGGQQALGGI